MDDLADRLKHLESISRQLEPDQAQRRGLQNEMLGATEDFLESLADGPAYIGPEHYSLNDFDTEIKETKGDVRKIFASIEQYVDKPGINPASGKHLGYIPGGGLFSSAIGDYWADITNRYSGIFFADPGAVKLENDLIRWMIQLMGYPDSAWGNLSSGGSIANLTAVVAAREEHGIKPDNVHKAVIYLSEQTHHCVDKALRIAGLHHAIVRMVPLDHNLRMNPEAYANMVEADARQGLHPFLLVSSAGTTDAGVVDPMVELGRISIENKVWNHVDAAYGGFFMLSDLCKDELKGIELSDSLVIDPHKGLFLPYGLGVVLVREKKRLRQAFSYQANYMQDAVDDEDEISPAEVSPELTKHFRGLRMWLPLKLHGLKPFRAGLDEKHLLAKYFAEEIIKVPGFQVFAPPQLSVVMFRFSPDSGGLPIESANKYNQDLIRLIHEDGRVFLSTTRLQGLFWLRVAVVVFRTHKETIDLTIQILKEKVTLLRRTSPVG